MNAYEMSFGKKVSMMVAMIVVSALGAGLVIQAVGWVFWLLGA